MLIFPEFLLRPFADSGNITQVPQTSPDGFVNYTDGYTSQYEISLNANNPQAKAVERPIQNYLFKTLTQNAMAWQRQGFPAWQPPVAGFAGYDNGAFVFRGRTNDSSLLFRSLIDNNLTDPINSPAAWELQPTVADTVSRISMPMGGALGPSGAVISFGVDFNTASDNGMFMTGNDAVAAACQNAPVYPGAASAVAGYLEVAAWTFATVKYVVQKYTTTTGLIATRSAAGNTWSSWTFKPSIAQVQAGVHSFLTITSTNGTNYTGTTTPAVPEITNGMELKVIIAGSSNAANATFNYAGLTANAPIFGMSGARVTTNELRLGASATLRWSAGVGWLIMNVSGGFLSGRYTAIPSQLVVAGQAQDGSMTYAADTGSTVTANAYAAEYTPPIPSPTPGMVLRFLAATTNTGAPTFKCTSTGAVLPIRDVAGGVLSAGIIQTGAICEITFNAANSTWLLTGTTGTTAASAVPVGGIILVSTPTVPVGFLECDGSLQLIATLPSLYANIGTYYNLAGDPANSFRLPNGRGVFVRGADNGRGVDPSRTLGTLQQPDTASHSHTGTTANAGSHTHNFNWNNTPTSADNPGIGAAMHYAAIGQAPQTNRVISAGDHNHTFTTNNTGGTETRPINVAWMYCIKAFDVPVNQATIDVAALLAQVNAQRRMEPGLAVYNAAGSYQFTVPADTVASSVFEVEVWGGGGGGSGQSATVGGQGGGGGGYSYKLLKGLTPGAVINVTVGQGGVPGTSGSPGGLGGNSGFGTYCVANGGGRTTSNSTIWLNSVGGTAAGGDVNITGAPGIGSGGYGTTVAGQLGGNGGNSPRGGSGGAGGTASGGATNGATPGGGGGGGGPGANPAAGADGAVVIRYR